MEAVTTAAGLVRAVSVPNQMVRIEDPDNSPTKWRTYADTKSLG